MLSVMVVPAHAAQFNDIETHWAKSYIEDMARRNLAKGYPDTYHPGEYSFKPEGKMTAAETLLFCARATGLDTYTQDQIARDLESEMDVLPHDDDPNTNDMRDWAGREMAVAVETGVLSLAELGALAGSGALSRAITREDICMYLVRAMQLEPLARGISTYPLNYKDVGQISESLKPYIYVLTNYGVVKGTDLGLFNPKGTVTRAEMTTMLYRALKTMSELGIEVELSEYTSYDWRSGVITAVSQLANGTTAVTVSDELTQALSQQIVTSSTVIFKDNMRGELRDLREGRHVRFNLSSSGRINEVRLGGTEQVFDGNFVDLTQGALTLEIGGVHRSFQIDRFTKVAVGDTVVTRGELDEYAAYTSARCWVDEMGHLAAVRFNGGTQQLEGLLESVSVVQGETRLGLIRFNGEKSTYTLSAGSPITVNGQLRALNSYDIGAHVQLRVRNDDVTRAESAQADTLSKYLQGPIQKTRSTGVTKVVTIRNVFTNKNEEYTISTSAPVTYYPSEGVREAWSPARVEKGWYVTALVSNTGAGMELITMIEAYPASTQAQGRLTAIGRDKVTTLTVAKPDGESVVYTLDMEDLPIVTRNGVRASLVDLRTGDQVTLTVRYNEVTQIEATSQSANLTGKITGLKQSVTDGWTMSVRLDDATEQTFTLDSSVSVTLEGKSANIGALKLDQTVALVTDGNTLIAIDITAAPATDNYVSGRVWLVNSGAAEKTITLEEPYVTVNVTGAQFFEKNGTALTLGAFKAGDEIRAYGAYDGAAFIATLVVRESVSD